MKNDVDTLVNVAIARRKDKFNPIARISEIEPPFVITKRRFKKWKTVKYEFSSSHSAFDKFNETMEKLQNCLNIEIDFKHSDVIKKTYLHHALNILILYMSFKYFGEM